MSKEKKEKIDKLRQKLYSIIYQIDTIEGKVFHVTLLVFILLGSTITILDSVIGLDSRYHQFSMVVEWFITICFTIEYATRIFCVAKRRKYIVSFFGIVDLMAILPAYLNLFIPGMHYLLTLRLLRLLRVFKVLKLSRFVRESNDITLVLKQSAEKISIFMFFIVILVIILGAIMYVVEGSFNPDFANIPRSVYWAVVTLTTVGYGDITPITFLGQLISVVIMILGYAIIAVPTGIISSEMVKMVQEVRKELSCPECGVSKHDKDAHFCKQCGSSLEKKAG